MALMRLTGFASEVTERRVMPGDIVAGGESISAGAITTAGSGVISAAAIVSGIVRRTGPGGAFTDTTDTAANIVSALLSGSGQLGPDFVPGTSFRLLYQNTVAFAMTFAAGVGVIAGTGTLNVAASTVREYLVTLLNANPVQVMSCNTTNASTAVTFVQPINTSALPMLASNGLAGVTFITPGMSVTGTGIAAGTTVVGATQGLGGVTGVTLSAPATATNTNIALTFGPTVQIDGLCSMTL